MGNIIRHTFFPGERKLALLADNAQGALHCRSYLAGSDGLELKYCAPAEQCAVYIEIGVFRRRGNQGNRTIFHKLQQGLLLLLIEILNLIQIQQYAARSQHGSHIRHNIFDVLQ